MAGVETNIGFLRSVLQLPEVKSGEFTTRLIDQKTRELVEGEVPPQKFKAAAVTTQTTARVSLNIGNGNVGVPSPMPGVLVSLLVAENEPVGAGTPIAVLEAMKMEHVVTSHAAGYVRQLAQIGSTVGKGDMLIVVEQRRSRSPLKPSRTSSIRTRSGPIFRRYWTVSLCVRMRRARPR